MATQQTLLETPETRPRPGRPIQPPTARLKTPNREQLVIDTVDLEQLIPADHLVRAIWEIVQQLPTAGFLKDNKSVAGHAGRPRTCPKMLLSMWVYGYSQGMGEANAIANEMKYEPGLRWLAGNDVISARTLSEFRIAHGEALCDTFASLLGILEQAGLIDLNQVTLDGTKVKSAASRSSFRRGSTLSEHIERAAVVVKQLENPQEAQQISAQKKAAQQRAAEQRLQLLTQSVSELENIRKSRKSAEDCEQARVSLTDPEARVMKDGHGNFAPSFNVQVVTETKNKFIINIAVTQSHNDQHEFAPALDRLQQLLDRLPGQMIVDGGYTTAENIRLAAARAVDLIGPELDREGRKARNTARSLKAANISPDFAPSAFVILEHGQALRCPAGCELKRRKETVNYVQYVAEKFNCGSCVNQAKCCPSGGQRSVKIQKDDPAVIAFADRMSQPESKQLYGKRGEVAEFPHAWIKDKLGLAEFVLRGLRKVNIEALWAALTYNIQQWFRLDWRMRRAAA